jgi:hypothetical protein
MARMKFICDAERCIECYDSVTMMQETKTTICNVEAA